MADLDIRLPAPGEPMVEVEHLTAGYDGKVIIEDVSFTLRKGEIMCIIGGSGCGKSTVIRTLVGLLRPMGGVVRVFGLDPHSLEDHERVPFLRHVGMMFQNGALLGSMTVGDNVALPYKEHSRLPDTVIERIVESKLAMVGLPHAARLLPAELSGGMRKRASLSRAMVMDPELLVCDEPSAGLDPIVAAGIDKLLREIQRDLGTTMVVVTHDIPSVEIIADRVVMLDRGRVLAEGTVPEMQNHANPAVRDFFARKPPEEAAASGQTLLAALEEEG